MDQSKAFSQNQIARIITVDKTRLSIRINGQSQYSVLSGKLRYDLDYCELPVVGDYVEVSCYDDQYVINKVLPRTSFLSRANAETIKKEQPMCANIDNVLLFIAADKDFNFKKVESYIINLSKSEFTTSIVLTKCDLLEHSEALISQIEDRYHIRAFGISHFDDNAILKLRCDVIDGYTTALVGSSGVGKSTFVNKLFKSDIQKTQNISERHGEGLHTTTKRSLLYLDESTCIIDMPGMRSISSFNEIGDNPIVNKVNEYALECSFTDCNHQNNKGCRVLEAVKNGEITQEAYAFFLKHKRVDAFFQDNNMSYHQEKKKAIKTLENQKQAKGRKR